MRQAPRLKRLCLLLLVASAVIATGASTAHAATEWKVGGKTFAELGISEASVLASAGESFVLTIPWYATEISCTTFSIESGKLLTAGASSGTLMLSGCSLKGPPFVAETCKLIEPISLKVKDKLITHSERAYDLFEAAEAGKAFGNVQFKEGTECPLPLSNELKGGFVAETQSGQRVKQLFTFSSTLEKLFTSDKLTFGTHTMELKGKATLDLGSPNEGKEWSAVPEKPEEPNIAGEYEIEGKTLTEKGITSESISFTISAGKLLIPGFPLTIKCTGGVASSTILLGGGIHVSALFSGCGAEGSSTCKPYETKEKMESNQTADKGFISASGLGEIILMGGSHYIVVSATEAFAFTTIYWPKLCSLALAVKLFGSTVFSAPNALTQLVNQTLSTISQAELGSLFPNDILQYENQTSWLDEGGTTNAALAGANAGKTWGGE